jgi:O-6-methylguanine DNA methyltransferase
MRTTEDRQADAVIRVGGLVFEVWLSAKGVTRVVLPDLGVGPARSRGDGQGIRIDIREGLDMEGEALAGQMGAFLERAVDGLPAEALPAVDLEGVSAFTREVLEVVASIPPGRSRSYGWVAERVGKPGAARAVGGAVGRNPVPLLVPCHRVVRSDGSTGGWSGAPGWKEYLLEQEAR